MTTIYMIRHAEAEGNLYRIVQGQHNSFITPRGHRQIACLAERFKDVQLDALYSSDLRRTVTTAGAITKYHALEMQLTERLREINLGVCEGMSFGDMYKFDPVQMDNFNNDPAQWRAPGAETFAECTERIVSAVTEIAVKTTVRLSPSSATAWRSARCLRTFSASQAAISPRFRTATTPP